MPGKASTEYDDLVLEQFTDLGEGCAWCPEFYKSIREMMMSADITPDQRSYYAEVLAVSGQLNNVKALVEATKNADTPEKADLFAEALELSTLHDDSVAYLKEQMESDNQTLREASIAAITNQGSRLAVETLYKHTVEKGDPDGYYSMGIGLGELIPDEEAFPLLQEILNKRDQYSHLAVKGLLNAGLPGLRLVFDALTSSPDPELDKQMLKDAADHVSYEEEVEKYLQNVAENSKHPVAAQFAKDILDDFKVEEENGQEGAEQ